MSTWGQLRLTLQTSAPGLSLDLIDEFLNARYEQVLEATDWEGLKAHATIQTTAAYQSLTDTATLTVGSAAVTGVGTAWTSAITGRQFYRPGDTVIYTASYVTGTSLLLDRAYEGNGSDAPGTVYSGSAYVMMTNVYALPNDCKSIVTVLDPVSGLPMQGMSKDGLDASVGPRTNVNDPKIYAGYDDSSELNPPVLRQIEFYPPPLRARGCPLEYLRTANAFDGGNTAGSPLPFVSNTVLLAGVRADIAIHMEKLPKAAGYEKMFEVELARLLRVEHTQRRPKTALKMADRFTRHRLARVDRGYGRTWGQGQGGPN